VASLVKSVITAIAPTNGMYQRLIITGKLISSSRASISPHVASPAIVKIHIYMRHPVVVSAVIKRMMTIAVSLAASAMLVTQIETGKQ